MRLLRAFLFVTGLVTLAACTSPPILPSIHSQSTSSTVPTPGSKNSASTSTSTSPPEPNNSLSPDKAQGLAVYALGLVGTPYKWGGNTPDSGFDCSGLIGYVYQAQTGVKSPRTVASLKNWGHEVSREQIRTGDILIFGPLNEPTHAGIYVGEDRFVHAPSTGGTVRLNKLTTAYWREKELTIRRPLN